jgi:hypothetical protein
MAVEPWPLPAVTSTACPFGRLRLPCGWKARSMLRIPRPKTGSVPGAPASSALANRICMICCPLRLGKALASKAAAPLITGAEKDVPDHRNVSPLWSGARTPTPIAVR